MIKYITISFFIGILFLHQTFSQQKKVSSYKSISKRNLKLDRSVPDLLREAEAIRFSDTKGALDKVEEALAQSILQKSSFNQATCYLLLGKINEQTKEWAAAIENYNLAFDRLQTASYKETKEYRSTLDGLIKSNSRLGNYEESLKHLDLKQKAVKSPVDKAKVELDRADIYFLAGNYKASKNTLEKGEQVLRKNKLSTTRAQAIRTKLLASEGNTAAAADLYQQSQAPVALDDAMLTEDQKEESLIAFEESKEEIINAYVGEGKLEKEIDLRNQAIVSNTLRKKPLKVVKEKQALSKALIETGKTSSAIKELTEAVLLADSLQNFKELASANKGLAEAWNKKGSQKKALRYYQKYSEALEKAEKQESKAKKEKEAINKKQRSISSLTKELALDESEYELKESNDRLATNQLNLQRTVIYGLLFLLGLAVVASILIYRNAVKSKTMSQLLTLKSLRSQMNPHFIFNALNSVNQFIAKNDERAANKFLSEFSKLMRLVLDNSHHDFITLAEEKEIIALYLKLEHYRFRDKFTYDLTIDESLSLDTIEIPPMLIQPYIENAVWHGLRYKKEMGHLSVSLTEENQALKVVITDNGIGRTRSKELKTDNQKAHQSTGLKNTEERINIINKVYQKKYSVTVSDVENDGSGTSVILSLPQ
ncbi:MAG: histidine kinase [Cyclobacteriaceae bacterium]